MFLTYSGFRAGVSSKVASSQEENTEILKISSDVTSHCINGSMKKFPSENTVMRKIYYGVTSYCINGFQEKKFPSGEHCNTKKISFDATSQPIDGSRNRIPTVYPMNTLCDSIDKCFCGPLYTFLYKQEKPLF